MRKVVSNTQGNGDQQDHQDDDYEWYIIIFFTGHRMYGLD